MTRLALLGLWFVTALGCELTETPPRDDGGDLACADGLTAAEDASFQASSFLYNGLGYQVGFDASADDADEAPACVSTDLQTLRWQIRVNDAPGGWVQVWAGEAGTFNLITDSDKVGIDVFLSKDAFLEDASIGAGGWTGGSLSIEQFAGGIDVRGEVVTGQAPTGDVVSMSFTGTMSL